MAISVNDVSKVASLARLEFSADEMEQFTSQLAQIVEYVDQLSEVPTEEIVPMAHAVEVTDVFRSDEIQESLTREAALANAPQQDGTGYLVPPVFGTE